MRAAALAVSVVTLAAAQVFRAPPPAFEQNVGQLADGILCAAAGHAFEPSRVRFSSAFALEFAGSAPAALVPQGEPFPINVYRGSDRARWRTGVPTYSRLLQAGLYPGIDAEWRIENRQIMLRLSAAPGADLQAVLFRFSGDPTPSVAIGSAGVGSSAAGAISPVLGAPVATETCSTGPRRLVAVYERHDPQTARLTVGAASPACPVAVDIPFAVSSPNLTILAHAVDSAGSVFLSGWAAFAAPLEPARDFVYLAKFRRDGTMAFLTIFGGGAARDVKIGNGEVFVTGVSWGGLPITADAPQAALGGAPDVFLARFRADGALLSSTYWGAAGEETVVQTALDPEGNLYFCGSAPFVPTTAGALAAPDPPPGGRLGFLAKWTPGLPRLPFSASFPYAVNRMALGRDGSIALASHRYDHGPTTAGVLQNRPLTCLDLYCAKLDATASRYLWGTFLPTADPVERLGFALPTALVIDQAGDLWTGAALRIDGTEAYALVKVKGDGSRLLFAESSPVRLADASDLTLDAAGSLLVVGSTAQMAHPTSPDAPLRGGCDDSASLHLRKLSPNGALLYGTYLRAGRVSGFDGQGRPYLAMPASAPQTLERMELAPTSEPAIQCANNSAGRMLQSDRPRWFDPGLNVVAPGQLLTLLGTALGPPATVDGRPDAAGNFPTQLAGVRVLLDGAPAPILSAQYGWLTFRVPAVIVPGGQVNLKVEAGGRSSSIWTARVVPSALQLATVDGHGFGHAAALNQDGSLNSPSHPALPGSVISVWGTGDGVNQRVQVLASDLPAEVLFAGQAPGLAPGVTQINFRLPAAVPSDSVPVSVLAGELAYRQAFPWPRVVISVGNGCLTVLGKDFWESCGARAFALPPGFRPAFSPGIAGSKPGGSPEGLPHGMIGPQNG